MVRGKSPAHGKNAQRSVVRERAHGQSRFFAPFFLERNDFRCSGKYPVVRFRNMHICLPEEGTATKAIRRGFKGNGSVCVLFTPSGRTLSEGDFREADAGVSRERRTPPPIPLSPGNSWIRTTPDRGREGGSRRGRDWTIVSWTAQKIPDRSLSGPFSGRHRKRPL